MLSKVQKDISNNFAALGNVELKVGRSEIDKFSDANVELRNRYLFLSFFFNHLSFRDNNISNFDRFQKFYI